MLQGNKREEKEGKPKPLNVLDTFSQPVHPAWPLTPGPSPERVGQLPRFTGPQSAVWLRGLGVVTRRGAFPGLLRPFGDTLNPWCPGSRLLSWDEREHLSLQPAASLPVQLPATGATG